MQAIERAFAVMRAVRGIDGAAGVTDVARMTGLPKSTVSRLLAALEEVGAVDRVDAGGGYMIGPGIASLTDGGTSFGALREVARPYLRYLTDEFGESSGLVVADGTEALYVDHLPSRGAVTTRDWTGMRFPFHTVAGGIAIMMTWSEAAVNRATSSGLKQLTPRTISTPQDLKSRLLTARHAGYAWTFGEFDLEINGVAAPVRNSEGRAIGALSAYGPSYRFPGDRGREEIGETVRQVCQSAEEQIRG